MMREQALNWRWETDREPWQMRGNQGTTMATQQLAKTNELAGQQGQQASGLENQQLIPLYQSYLKGAPPSVLNAINNPARMSAATAPIASAADSAAVQQQNEAARTRNSAGLTASEDQLALEKGQAIGQAASGVAGKEALEGAQANELYNELGAGGLQKLYGSNEEGMLSLYGLGPQTINAWTGAENAANQPPWGASLIPGLAGGAAGLIGAIKGGGK